MRSDWLEAFLVFGECLNFTRAAEQLHISQPALHTKIRRFAEFLGLPLYRKVGRELHLTAEGRRILAFAREMRDRSDSFLDELRFGATTSDISLAAGEGAFLYLLGPAIAAFLKRDIARLRLISANREGTLDLLRSGEAQLGVAALHALPRDCRSELLTVVDQVLVLPKDHPLARKRRIRLSDLQGASLILPPDERPHRMLINRALMNAGVEWRLAVEARGWELMLHFCRLGLGLTIVNSCCRIPSGLRALPMPELPQLHYHVIARNDGWNSPALKSLRDCLFRYKDRWKS